MSDARLSILLSADTAQAEAGFEKLSSAVKKTESTVEKSTAGMTSDLQGFSSATSNVFTTLQSKVQGFGGGTLKFTPPKLDLSSVKPIPSSVEASVEAVNQALDTLGKKGFVSLGSVTAAMKELQAVIKTTSNTSDLAKLNVAYQQLAEKSRQLKSVGLESSFNKIGQSSNSANIALINTGRVIQDLPFGFLGIANNLNPLLESFQRLKAETGSTGTALKSLASSLGGAQGIGIAVSLISSALIVFGDALFGTKKAAEDNAVALGVFNNSVKEITGSVDDLTKSLNFLNELGAINIDIAFGKGISSEILKQQSNFISGQQEMQTLTEKLAAATKKSEEAAHKFFSGLEGPQIRIIDKFGTLAKIPADVAEKFSKSNQKLLESAQGAAAGVKKVQEAIDNLTNSQTTTKRTIALLNNDKLKEDADKAKQEFDKLQSEHAKFVSETISRGKQLADFFESHRVVPVFGIFDTDQTKFTKALKFIKEVEAGDIKIKVNKAELIAPTLDEDIIKAAREKLKQAKETLKSVLTDESTLIGTTIKFQVPAEVNIILKKNQEDAALRQQIADKIRSITGIIPNLNIVANLDSAGLEKFNEELSRAAAITQVISPAINQLVDAIGRGENAFQAFGNAVKQILAGVAKKLIETAVLAAALSAITGGGSSFGSLFKKLLGFAEGGRPEPGKVSLVGEKGDEAFVSDAGKITMLGDKGPQLFKPTTPGHIIPSYALGSLKGKSPVYSTVSKVSEKVFVSDASKQIEKLVNSFKEVATNTISSVTSVVRDHFKSSYTDKSFASSSDKSDVSKILSNYFRSSTDKASESLNVASTLVSDHFKSVISDSNKLSSEKLSVSTNELFKLLKSTDSKESESSVRLLVDKLKISDYAKSSDSTIQTGTKELTKLFGNYFQSSTSTDKQTEKFNDASRLISNAFTSDTETSATHTGTKELTRFLANFFDSSVSDSKVTAKESSTDKSASSVTKELSRLVNSQYYSDTSSKDRSSSEKLSALASKLISDHFLSITSDRSLVKPDSDKQSIKEGSSVKELSKLFNYFSDKQDSDKQSSTFKTAVSDKIQSVISESKAFVSTATNSLKEIFSKNIDKQSSKDYVKLQDHFNKVVSDSKSLHDHFFKSTSSDKLTNILSSYKSTDSSSNKESNNKETNNISSEISKLTDHYSGITKLFNRINESTTDRSVFNRIETVLSKIVSFNKDTVLGKDKIKESFSTIKELVSNKLVESFRQSQSLGQLTPAVSSSKHSDSSNIFNHNIGSWFTKKGDFINSIANGDSVLSNLFKTFNQVISHRQFGGAVAAGQPFFVGENGRELFIPQTAGTIIPKGNMNGLGGGLQNIVVEVIGRVAGNDILLSGNRQSRSNNRNS